MHVVRQFIQADQIIIHVIINFDFIGEDISGGDIFGGDIYRYP